MSLPPTPPQAGSPLGGKAGHEGYTLILAAPPFPSIP